MSFEGRGTNDRRVLTYQGDRAEYYGTGLIRYTGGNYLNFATTVALGQWEGLNGGNPLTSWNVDIGSDQWGFAPFNPGDGNQIIGFFNTSSETIRTKAIFECSGRMAASPNSYAMCLDLGTTRKGTVSGNSEPFSQMEDYASSNNVRPMRVERILDVPAYGGNPANAVFPYFALFNNAQGMSFLLTFARIRFEAV